MRPARGMSGPARRVPEGVFVAIGGAAGTLVRAGAAAVFPDRAEHFPSTILVVNLLGAFVLGWLLRRLVLGGPDEGLARAVRLGVGTGVMGGFTTYSTFAVQTAGLLRSGHSALAAAYVTASLAGGFLCCLAGTVLADRGHARGRPA